MLRLLPLALLPMLACSGSDDGGTDTGVGTDTGAAERTFEDFVNVTEAYTGNTTCFTGTPVVQTVDPSCQQPLTLDGTVLDFEEEEPVPDASVAYYADDDIINGTPELVQANASGAFTLEVTSCTPFAYGTFTPPDWNETRDTYEVHQIYGFEESEGSFNSVSERTATIIPTLIGIDWDEENTGIVAGTAYDCDQEPIAGAQIFLHDGTGKPPATGYVYYFSSTGDTNLPTSREDQPYSNTNGLWVAVNVPPGTWTIEMWAWDGAQLVELGSTQLQIKAGMIGISNVYTGDDDGVYYPASCLQACGG